DVRLQTLVDGKKVVLNEASIIRDLRLDDAEGFVQVFINNQLGDMSHHKVIFVNPSLTKKVFANIKRVGTCFSWEITPLFETRMVQAPKEVGEIPIDTQDTPILTQPSSSQPQMKHKLRRKQRKEIEVGLSARVESSKEEKGVGDQEDASKQGKIAKIKESKPRERGVIVQEPIEFTKTSSLQLSQLPQAKDKGKEIMVKPEKPLKKKDQIATDEEIARELEAQMKAKIEEEERIAREKVEANIA
nr:hypothetical protein [Tanacetum cinerariifolium]